MNEYTNQVIGTERHLAKAMAAQQVDTNPTVEENLDRRIRMLEAELERMKQSKADLGPLLKMRIRDIRQAMDY
jgi:hypothetical protein